MGDVNRQVVLTRLPEERLTEDHFELREAPRNRSWGRVATPAVVRAVAAKSAGGREILARSPGRVKVERRAIAPPKPAPRARQETIDAAPVDVLPREPIK